MNGLIQFEQLASIEALLTALRPNDARWKGDARSWIFRGHADATWELVPLALRDGFRIYAPGHLGNRKRTHARQIVKEHHVLVDFLEGCDLQGLPFPDDTYQTRVQWLDNVSKYVDRAAKGEVEWPPPHLLSMLALAQHYGVPTRLLDWTTRPLHAAYFAARDAVTRLRSGTQTAELLLVWALSRKALANLDDWHSSDKPRVSFVSPPPSQIPNALAQRGVFTVVTERCGDVNAPPTRSPLTDVIFDLVGRADPEELEWIPESFPWLRGFALPVTEAPRLLRLLEEEHVSAMYLFPGYKGVVEGLEERRHWDRGHPL